MKRKITVLGVVASALLLFGAVSCKNDAPVQLSAPENVRFLIGYDKTRTTSYSLSWDEVAGAESYSVSIKHLDGEFTTKRERYDLSSYLSAGQSYEVSVSALAKGGKAISEASVITVYPELVTVGLMFTSYDEGYAVTQGIAEIKTSIVVPDEYNDKPVVAVADGAFKASGFVGTILDRVRLPESIRAIGKEAFYNQAGMNMQLPSAVEKVDDMAFYGCKLVTGLVFPNSLSYIGESAFAGTGLTEIVLPESVTHVGTQAFVCEKLQSVSVAGELDYLGSDVFTSTPWFENQPNGAICFGDMFYYYKGGFAEPTELTALPEGVERFADGAFSKCENLVSVTIPTGLKSFGNQTFYSCPDLESVVFPEGFEEIGTQYFSGCINLKTVVLPSTLTKIGAEAFSYCSSLQEISLPSGVEFTGHGIFYGCAALKRIDLPQTIRVLPELTFAYSGLEEIAIPEAVEELGDNLFFGCEKLKKIEFAQSGTLEKIGDAVFARTGIERIALPALKVIPANFFYGSTSLQEVVISATTEQISEGAFAGCSVLKTVTFAENGALYIIGNSAFKSCVSLEEMVIPEGVSVIGEEAFALCEKLERLHFPSTLRAIDDKICYLCSSLEEVTMADGCQLSIISEKAFASCGGLSITFPKGVHKIEKDAFKSTKIKAFTVDEENEYFCSIDGNLYTKDKKKLLLYAVLNTRTSFTLPKEVEEISDGALAWSTYLKEILVEEGNTSFCSVDGNLYSADKKQFVQYAVGKEETSFTVPSTVTKIRTSAFAGKRFETLVIPNTVTEYDKGALDGCTIIKAFVPGEAITYLVKTEMKTLVVTGGKIEKNAVNYGTIETIIIGKEVSFIGGYAFNLEGVKVFVELESASSDWVDDWDGRGIGKVDVYYYREEEPTQAGNFWYYDADGNPVVWE